MASYGAEPPGHPRRIHGGVAAAIDRDAGRAAAPRRRSTSRRKRHGIEHLAGIARRDVGALASMRADRDEAGIEARRPVISATTSSTLWSSTILTPISSICRSRLEHVARQAVGGDAEMHHAAGQRAGIADLDRVPEPREVIGGRQPARPGADHQHALARRRGRAIEAASRARSRQSPRKRSTAWMLTALSSCARLQLSRTGDSRPGRAPPATGCRRSASATPPRSGPPARGRAKPGCSRPPGTRDCTAAADRHRPAAVCATARSAAHARDPADA